MMPPTVFRLLTLWIAEGLPLPSAVFFVLQHRAAQAESCKATPNAGGGRSLRSTCQLSNALKSRMEGASRHCEVAPTRRGL